jgi:hypothetical protein
VDTAVQSTSEGLWTLCRILVHMLDYVMCRDRGVWYFHSFTCFRASRSLITRLQYDGSAREQSIQTQCHGRHANTAPKIHEI